MNCIICNMPLQDSGECIIKYDGMPHYCFKQKNNFVLEKESIILYDIFLSNVISLNRKYNYSNAFYIHDSNFTKIFEIDQHIEMKKFIHLDRNQIIDKLKTYQLFS